MMMRRESLLLLAAVLALALAATPCTNDDYIGQYTQCRVDDTRDYVYYLKANVTCDPVVGIPPANSYGIPCTIVCPSGQYLAAGASSCSFCPPGTYSTSGSVHVDEWDSFPAEMGAWSTLCVKDSNPSVPATPNTSVCHLWTAQSEFVGTQNVSGDALSILQLTTTLLVNGNITFNMYTNGYMYFKIDNGNAQYVSVENVEYNWYTYSLSSGVHTLQWQYRNNPYVTKPVYLVRITDISIFGIGNAATECTACPPGTYTNTSGQSNCTNCPVNTISTAFNTSSCTPCGADEYAFSGDSTCSAMRPCTESDTVTLITNCQSDNLATATTSFLEPIICDTSAYTLPPPNPNVQCPPCNAGSDRSGDECVACASGLYSPGGDTTQCVACPAGFLPLTELEINTWNAWTNGITTNCTGDCGSNGWRLRGNFIDSGFGHGNNVQSVFYLPININSYSAETATVSFNHSSNCTLGCTLYVYDISSYYTELIQDFPSTPFTGWNPSDSFEISGYGNHIIKFVFEQQIDPVLNADAAQARTAVIQISSIQITNVAGGAAVSCTPCGAGKIVQNNQCQPCPAGTVVSADNTTCVTCTGNQYSLGAGAPCLECGAGTIPTADHSDCQWYCNGTINSFNYDINQVQTLMQYQVNHPYSIVDFNVFPFPTVYVSPCSRGPMQGADGECPASYTCADQQNGGYMPEMQVLDETNPYAGVKVHYFNGAISQTCPNGYEVYVNFTCYPDLNLIFNFTYIPNQLNFPTSCQWQVELQSAFGCPVCSMNDVGSYYTDCENGYRTQVFYMINPIRCNNRGLTSPLFTLPSPVNVSCSESTATCPAGQYLESGGNTCEVCNGGYSSDGGQLMIESWEPFPTGFFTSCSSIPCGVWTAPFADTSIIRSGTGTSTLIADVTYAQTSGWIYFDYKVYSVDGGQFLFYVDDVLQLNATTTNLDWITYQHPISTSGYHDFRWKFVGGLLESPLDLAFQAVYVRNVIFNGFDYHSDSCTPCPTGTYSLLGSSTCTPCSQNTANNFTGASTCSACPNTTYALPGSTGCTTRLPCKSSDYDILYGECQSNGFRSASLSPKQPSICLDTTPHTLADVACAPCPTSTYRSGANCVGCLVGQYWDNTQQQCVANPVGNTVQRSIGYWIDNSLTSWPAEFTSGCSGNCISTQWHIGNGIIDSGFNPNVTIDSWVTLTTNLVSDGSLSFNYNITGPNLFETEGFIFLVDDVVTPVPTYQAPGAADILVNISLPAGQHQITWNWHQDQGQDLLAVHSIIVQGAANSIITGNSVPCPPGQYSNDSTNVVCSVCPAGTYAQGPGAQGCTPCPAGQYAVYPGSSNCTVCEEFSAATGTGNEVCQPQCNFTLGGDNYALPFGSTVTIPAGTQQYYINVCGFTSECNTSHVCLASGASLIPFGSSYTIEQASDHFSIYFNHGNSPSCPDHASTEIDFYCEPSTTDSSPTLISNDGCTAKFSWLSASACPICQDSDYTEVVGVCSGGHRSIVKNRNTNCNGPATIAEPSTKCSSHEFPTGAVVAVVVVFAVVLAAGIGILIRNRILQKRYSSLLEDNKAHNAHKDSHL